jgi:hypothetical protein
MKISGLALVAIAAALSGCGLKPFVLSGVAPSVNRLDLPPAPPSPGSTEPEGPRADALSILDDTRSFDDSYEVYSARFEAGIKAMSATGVIPEDLPPEGMLFFFDERVLAEGRAYRELARYAQSKKDWARAERYALDAASLCDQRAFSDYARATGAREAWALLEKIETERKASGAALVAQLNRKLAEDFLASADGKTSERAFYEQEFADQNRAVDLNIAIAQENLRTQEQQLNAVSGALASAQSGLAGMQQQRIQSQANSQGYMTRSQASQMQSAQMAQLQAKVVMQMTAGRGGVYEQRFSLLTMALGPTSLRQFLSPNAGVNPTGIVQQFGELAKGLSPDPELTSRAEDVIRSAQKLGTARRGGPDAARGALEEFLPGFQKLIAAVRGTP